jgi:hypothetical protein
VPVVATAVLLLLQVPEGVASLSVVAEPAQTVNVPVIAAGTGFTVIIVVTRQPVGNEYEMLAVPAVTPDTMPDDEPTVAIAVALLVQVPPVVASPSVVVKPLHTLVAPVIDAGSGLTVTVMVVNPTDTA